MNNIILSFFLGALTGIVLTVAVASCIVLRKRG